MPVLADFSLVKFEDGVLTVGLQPAVPIGGWDMRVTFTKRHGQVSGYFTKCVASGYSAASGVSIVNSGNGVFSVTLDSVDTSGLEYGNYAYTVERMDSGHRTVLTEGYLLLTP